MEDYARAKFDPWDPTSYVPDPREQVADARPVVLTPEQIETAKTIRANTARGAFPRDLSALIVHVKDYTCEDRIQFYGHGHVPRCDGCGKAWTATYGPSNDASREVQIEIRAAELAHRPLFEYSDSEWSGWDDRDDLLPETDGQWAGWLSSEIEQSEVDDGQAEAVSYRPGKRR